MASLSLTGLTVIGALVVGHCLFIMRYPDDYLFGSIALVVVIIYYIYRALRKKESGNSDKKNVKINF